MPADARPPAKTIPGKERMIPDRMYLWRASLRELMLIGVGNIIQLPAGGDQGSELISKGAALTRVQFPSFQTRLRHENWSGIASNAPGSARSARRLPNKG